MDWPAFVGALAGLTVAGTGAAALVLRVRRRLRRAELISTDIEGLWAAMEDVSRRLTKLEAADAIERHDADRAPRGKRRDSRHT